MIKENTNIVCPYCGGKLANMWGNKEFQICSACRLIIRKRSPYSRELDRLYRESWLDPHTKMDETGATDMRLARIYTHQLARSLGEVTLSGMRILDFGAGRGSMTFALMEQGAQVVSVEPYGYDYLLQENITVYRSLSEIPNGSLFEGIVSVDVIEHLTNPWDVLRTLKLMLRSTGWLFISTPNSDGLNARIRGERWREARRAGHIYLFKPYTITQILSELGFITIKRLRWYVPYSENKLIQLKDYILSILRLDGEIRYLAYVGE